MRSTVLTFSLLSFALAPLAACAVVDDGAESSEEALTEEELAKRSLALLGAKVPNAEQQCQRCHDINTATLQKWADDYKTSMEFLSDEAKSREERINWMRRDPTDPTSTFAPAKLGFLTAGTHFGASAAVSRDRHPTLYRQMQVLRSLFQDDEQSFKELREQTLMPIEPEYDRLAPSEYETIASWVDKGMPMLTDILREEPRPTSCEDDFEGLRAHAVEIRSKSWEAQNRDMQMPMFACDASGRPLECFTQQRDGEDIFPEADTREYGKGWAADGSKIRVLRELDYRTYFWTRNSADGRFVANGKSGGGETGAVIADLAASLDAEGVKTRDIGASARYDPDFWPDNQGFMFQGTSAGGGVFCPQSLLTNPETTKVTFSEPECSKLNSVGLYQSIGQRIGDNAIADHFLVNGKFASDNPGQTANDRDLKATFGPDAKAIVRVMFARGNDAEEGYEVKQSVELDTPFEGDIMMSRSTALLGARVAGEEGPLGYSIRKLTSTMGAEGYRFSLKPVGRICMPGNKANFSFDERFLTTHHYLTREDFASDDEFAGYAERGGADIYVADFVTGKKVRITRMGPGQFAIFPHFRSDGWLYFLVRDASNPEDKKEYIVASDWAIRQVESAPTR